MKSKNVLTVLTGHASSCLIQPISLEITKTREPKVVYIKLSDKTLVDGKN